MCFVHHHDSRFRKEHFVILNAVAQQRLIKHHNLRSLGFLTGNGKETVFGKRTAFLVAERLFVCKAVQLKHLRLKTAGGHHVVFEFFYFACSGRFKVVLNRINDLFILLNLFPGKTGLGFINHAGKQILLSGNFLMRRTS